MMKSANIAYIGIGSNLGQREQYMMRAVQQLDESSHTRVLRCSHMYETEPIGYVDQPAFLNMVIVVETLDQPKQLHAKMVEIEQAAQRVRKKRWGPRTLDLDLLLYNDLKMNDATLIIPHPRMTERQFVIVPLLDVWHGSKQDWRKILQELQTREGKDGIQLWKTIEWHSESGHFAN